MNVNFDPRLRVEHPKVLSGKWATTYNKPEPNTTSWRVASELTTQYEIRNGRFEPKYTTYAEMIDDMFSLLTDFKLEGWRERKVSEMSRLIGLKAFDLVYVSSGSSPQKVPFWGPSKIDLTRVFGRNELAPTGQVFTNKEGDNWTKNTSKERHYTNVWIGSESPAPIPLGMRQQLKELVHIFGFPFYFYEKGNWDKPVGSDPFRMHLMVGVGDYLPPRNLRKAMNIMTEAGVIDPQELSRLIPKR